MSWDGFCLNSRIVWEVRSLRLQLTGFRFQDEQVTGYKRRFQVTANS